MEIKADAVELRLKKDGKVLAILTSGAQLLPITKNGIIKNYSLLEKLETIKIKLPAYYLFEYDSKNQAYTGSCYAYNPNSKRSKDK